MDNKKQFKIIDLIIFSFLGALTEYLGYVLINRYETAGFIFSFSFLLALIAIYRWGISGSIVFIVSGLVHMIIDYFNIATFVFYVLGNCFIIFTPLLFRIFYRNKIKKSALLLFLYTLLPMVVLAIGKGLIIFIFDKNYNGIIDYFASQLFTILITFIFLSLVVHIEGLFENMNTYIQDREELDEA